MTFDPGEAEAMEAEVRALVAERLEFAELREEIREAVIGALTGASLQAILIVKPVVAERDRMRRLFNRLEAAISYHKLDKVTFNDDVDDALYVARDRILRDYAEGSG